MIQRITALTPISAASLSYRCRGGPMKMSFVILALFFLSCSQDSIPPRVTETVPANGDRAVEPGPMVMSATFSEEMMAGNYSWAYTTPETFPEINGEPGLEKNGTVATLPVVLAPNTEYEVWINSPSHANFKDKAGNVAVPYKLVFKTR